MIVSKTKENRMTEQFPLFSLLIEITKKCNAKCDQCGSRCDIHSEELLTKEQILAALRDVKEHIGTDAMINISGGEPLMRRDLFEIMTEVTAMGFDWGMVTNGSLITDEVIEKMKSSGMKTITISLDGLRETHDSLRHLPGSYDKILVALRKLKAAAFLDHLQVTFIANKRNVYTFEKLYKILDPIGLDSIRVSIIDPIGRAQDNMNLMLSREEILYFTGLVNRLNAHPFRTLIVWSCPHYLGKLVRGRVFRCSTGIHTASILANGDIFVCPNVPHRPEFIQGNILRDSFSEVWENGFRYFRQKPIPQKCRDCAYLDKCKGDSVHTMDFDRNEPLFCYRDQIAATDAGAYKESLFARYPDLRFCEISSDDPDAGELIIEPDAFDSIRQYFHIGSRHPLSMYEQQMALVGFLCGDTAVVRYVIPCDGALRASDNAIFSPRVMVKVEQELHIINKNYYRSGDRALVGSECSGAKPMRFLGFIHSHPIQHELQYSVGDDNIHMRLYKRFGAYYGVLVNPADGTLGAYYGPDIKQAKLVLPEVK